MAPYVPLTSAQSKAVIDCEQQFDALRAAKRRVHELRGGMHYKRIAGKEYLYRVTSNKESKSLGPRSPDGRPVGGRSLSEFAIEARYRFGNFGIVPFVDAGQVYEGIYPTGQNMRFGAGIGGRYYTNFGPLRIDVATPIARKPGESKVALYISIGQAF